MGYYADEKAVEVAVRDLFRWYEENKDRDFPTNTIRAYLNFTLTQSNFLHSHYLHAVNIA